MNQLDEKFFSYKDKPLVRCKNTIYYGSMLDEYVCMLQITGQQEQNGEKIAQNVLVQLMRTDKNAKPQDIVVKKSEKPNLYQAIDIADVWLRRALSE